MQQPTQGHTNSKQVPEGKDGSELFNLESLRCRIQSLLVGCLCLTFNGRGGFVLLSF